MKRILALALTLALVLTACAPPPPQKREATFLTLFDTVTTVVGYCAREEDFNAQVQLFHDELQRYHELYDIYHTYDGLVNLKTLNDHAGKGPLAVPRELFDLLKFAKEAYSLSQGAVNAAMGSVLSLWHAQREAGIQTPAAAKLPDPAALKEAGAHRNMADLILDEVACTAELRDPGMSLDVGAIAKGYAVERVCQSLATKGLTHLLISVGGNVRALGDKQGGTPWVVGIEDPAQPEGAYLKKIYTDNCAVVTSGSYQRYYTVEGVRYHHIIDPQTLSPGQGMTAVTVVCPDSGLADVLSTTLFLLPQERGEAILKTVPGAEALWLLPDGTQVMSKGFPALVKP